LHYIRSEQFEDSDRAEDTIQHEFDLSDAAARHAAWRWISKWRGYARVNPTVKSAEIVWVPPPESDPFGKGRNWCRECGCWYYKGYDQRHCYRCANELGLEPKPPVEGPLPAWRTEGSPEPYDYPERIVSYDAWAAWVDSQE
jgi:hypothetical protein